MALKKFFKLIKILLLALFVFYFSKIFSQEKIVKLGSSNWQPYSGIELKNYGICAEIVREAFKQEGYTLQISFSQWTKAAEDAKNGLLDGAFPGYYDRVFNGRSRFFYYSQDIFEGSVGFLSRSSDKIPYVFHKDLNKTYDSLKYFKFGIVRNYINEINFDLRTFESSNQFEKYGRDLEVEISANDEINIRKLFEKKVDLIFIDKLVSKYLIEKNYPNNINDFKFLEPHIRVNKIYILFSKKSKNIEEKIKAFDRGFKKIKENGILKKIITDNPDLIKLQHNDFL